MEINVCDTMGGTKYRLCPDWTVDRIHVVERQKLSAVRQTQAQLLLAEVPKMQRRFLRLCHIDCAALI
eukprot:932323-Amphidinium_carterae.1